MIDLEHILERIHEIPPMPDVVLKVLELAEDEECSAKDLVEVIKLDQGITLRVLRLCNSAHYGLPRQVHSLQDALVFLGNSTLVNFILTSYVTDHLQAANAGYGLAAGDLWRHAVAVALASDIIGQHHSRRKDTGLLFTAGLLHDMGKIILNDYLLAELHRIDEHLSATGCSFIEAERAVIGHTHAEIGGHLADHWNLPQVLVNAILHHHEPLQAEEHTQEVAVIHLANILCLSLGYGLGRDGLRHHFEPEALKLLGLTENDLLALAADLHSSFEKAVALIRLAH
ncbi:HDOD domain-containing protein [Candidatus Sumerlaeota bacterium]|nr:HDOD domain-containing protein [Candidatus Sumerlaeota bacterium]